jgi:multiple sugar transport system substrate-binding protein
VIASNSRFPSFKQWLFAGATAIVSVLTCGASAQAQQVVKFAYSADYYPSTPQMLSSWVQGVQQAAKTLLPGVTIEPEPIHGGFDDFLTKLSLMYGNPSTAPDLALVPAQEVGQWQGSGLLTQLDSKLKATDWWPKFVPAGQQEGQIDGKTYYVSMGDNNNALLFDKTIFAKAGLPADWQPKTWDDILSAARAIKKADPSVWPLWLLTGTAQGSEGVIFGAANLLVTSDTPVAFDTGSGKWVAESKGLREVINFYRTAASEGLLAPPSEILDPNGPGILGPFLPKHKVGIAFAGNYVPTVFNKTICGPCWADAQQQLGIAPIPTSSGQAPGVGTTMSGWGLVLNAHSKDPDDAWKVLNLMMSKDLLLQQDLVGGLVPPILEYNKEPVYANFAPGFQTPFAELAAHSTTFPSNADFKVWAFALAQATETVVLHPNTSVELAAKGMKSYISNQLDDSEVEVLK